MKKNKKSLWQKLTGSSKDEDEFEVEEEEKDEVEEVRGILSEEEEEGELAIDLHQTPNDIILKTIVAGIRPEDIDISISRDMVTIKGKREESHDIIGEDYFHKELYWGAFSRTVILPTEINVDEAEALNKNGMLLIKLPKLDKNRQTKLKIKTT
ncbi:MAG: Hsp20/alpha crystallin family protein [Minisyncoccia bacterium]